MIKKGGFKLSTYLLTFLLLLFLIPGTASQAWAQPTFSKKFSPDLIGSGNITALTFVIKNNDSVPAMEMAFEDTLPAGITIAGVPNITNSCQGSVSATAGGDTITFSDGRMPGNASCTITVNVTGNTDGVYTNTTGDLTSSAGNSGTATDDLTINMGTPGFSKSFSPSAVSLGERSRLTFTIDNTGNTGQLTHIDFNDTFPAGMVIADPSNLDMTCPGSLTLTPGGSTIVYTAQYPDALAAGVSCTISVDVSANAVGRLDNLSGSLSAYPLGPAFETRNCGFAADSLNVTTTVLSIMKDFPDDPVGPGDSTKLTFTITNRDRSSSASGISFTDNLEEMMPGLVATNTPVEDPCGNGSSLTGSSTLILSDGYLEATEACTVDVIIQIPESAAVGSYLNTTSTVTGEMGGRPVTGNVASEYLFVQPTPELVKAFNPAEAVAGDTVGIDFTMTNPSSSASMTDISFTDEISSGMSVLDISPGDCSGAIFYLTSVGGMPTVSFTGGTLGSGESCTASLTLQLDPSMSSGTYTNTTSFISATVDGNTYMGSPASDTLTIYGAPLVRKSFTNDPILPGDAVTLEFTIKNRDPNNDVTDIAFTDDLDAVLSGLAATDLPKTDICGEGSSISGTSLLTFSNGNLGPDESCVFTVTLQTPEIASSGAYTNTTSNITASTGGNTVTGTPATDDLLIGELSIAKSFTNDPALPGGTVNLQFTITNDNSDTTVTNITFQDSLQSVISGLAPSSTDTVEDVCGEGSSLMWIVGMLYFTGGSLSPSSSCTFSVDLDVPAGVATGTYLNRTNAFSGNYGDGSISFQNATDILEINSDLLEIGKSFTDDPLSPDALGTLEFTITNLDEARGVTDITFSDNLDEALSGLVAVGLPAADVCGAGSQISGTDNLVLTGGNLAAGDSCTFSVTIRMPSEAAGGTTATNTTSGVSGMIDGSEVTGLPASDILNINDVVFSKSFSGPALQNGTVTLTFTIQNNNALGTVSQMNFTDDLDAMLSGLTAIDTPVKGECGEVSQLAGTSMLAFSRGDLVAGESCSFDVTLQVPFTAGVGDYTNTTSVLSSDTSLLAQPASDTLTVNPRFYTISGTLIDSVTLSPIPDATISFSHDGSSVTTNINGEYSYTVQLGTTTMVTPSKAGYISWSPSSVTYNAIGEDKIQDFVGTLATYTISGQVTDGVNPIEGATLTFSHDSGTTQSGPAGYYSYTVNYGTTTIITPGKTGYDTWAPSARTLTDITSDQGDQDFVGTLASYDLTVTKEGDGSGTVTSSPAGIDCGSTCSAVYDYGATVSLTPDAEAGHVFDGWSGGGCSGTGICQIFMDADQNIIATFSRLPVSDLSVTKETSTYLPGYGGNITFVVKVTNDGPEDAAGVEVTDPLPAGVTYLSDDSGGAYNVGTGVWTVGNLADGDTLALVIDARYDTEDVVTNTAQITHSDSYDPNPGNNTASVTIDPDADVADLWVLKLGVPKTVRVGDDVTYFITVANFGPDQAENVALTDLFSSDIGNVQYRISGSGAGYTDWPAGNVLSLGDLNFLHFKTIWIRGEVMAYPPDGLLVNMAEVSSDTLDIVTGNNTSTDNIHVRKPIPRCDLSVVKSSDKDTAAKGEIVVFTITATNNGPDDADEVMVDDRIRGGLTYLSDDSGGTYNSRTGLWQVGSLADGASATLNITTRVHSRGRIRNTASISGDGCVDENPANNSSTVTINDRGHGCSDMGLWSDLFSLAGFTSLDLMQLDNGEQFTYAVRYENNGSVSASGVQVQVTLPGGVGVVETQADAGCYDLTSNVWHVDDALACNDPSENQITADEDETGSTLTLTLEVTDAGSLGAGEVMAEIIEPSTDPDITNNSITRSMAPDDEFLADLALDVAADQTSISGLQTAVIKVTVRNNGPDAASSVQILNQVPPELTLVSSYPSQGSYKTQSGTWMVGSLSATATATLELTVVSAADAEAATFSAEISGIAESKLNAGNDGGQVDIKTQQSAGGGSDDGGCFLNNLLAR